MFAATTVAVFLVSGLAVMIAPGTMTARGAPPPFRSLNVGILNLAVTTYNPLTITLLAEYVVVYNVYSTLITYDGNYHTKPDLAYNWTLASDQVTWTFHLVHDAYFTDPTNPYDRSHPVTSADVVFSYYLNKNNTASILNSYTNYLQSISAPDPYTVVIVTTQPFAAMDSSASAITILPRYIWAGINNPVKYANSNPIGSGAMYYDTNNATFGSNIILRRNPNYFGVSDYCQIARPDQVLFKDYTNPSTEISDFQSGTSGLDAIMNVQPNDYLNTLPANGPGNPITKWAVDTGFVGEISLNVLTPQEAALYGYRYQHSDLTLNQTFRDAVAMSINKSALVQSALLGLGHVADTLVPDSNPWHYTMPANETFKFDTAAARKMLNDAGWNFTSTGAPATPTTTPLYNASGGKLSIRFYTLNTAPQWQQAAINITAWLAQSGIQTVDSTGKPGYSLMSVNQLSTAWFAANYDMWFWDWIFTPASDPSLDVMEVETTGAIGPTSDNYYSNATYDAIYNASLTETNPIARRALTNELQSIVYKYASYILPYYRLDLYAATNGRPNVPSGGLPGWTNYGNWSQSVGLTVDSDLAAPWFQVAPLDNLPPQIQSFPTVAWTAGSPAPLSVSAIDPESGPLTYDWNFGDGAYSNGTTTAAPTHTYAQPGTYTVTVRVMDSEWPVCASTTATIAPPSTQNQPPNAHLDAVPSSLEVANTSIPFNLTVTDPDGDPVYAAWTFGDGASATSYATSTANGVVVHQSHTYAQAGTYALSIRYSDNMTGAGAHTQYVNATLIIRAAAGGGGGGTGGQPVTPAANPWISYGVPLAVVAAIVLAVVGVVLRRRRQSRREEQESGPPQTPPFPPPPP